MSLVIRPLCAGRLIGLPKPTVTFMRGWGQTHDPPLLMFLIEGGETPVIVDTGPPGPERVAEFHGYRMEQRPGEEPAAVLAAAGVDPASVRLVIHTHLHWDHCSNTTMFPNATFVVQRRELDYACDPVEWHRPAFEKVPGVRPPWVEVFDRVRTVDGDTEVAPGIRLVFLPGHTPGSQGILVDTAAGRYLIAGDTVDTYENWNGDEKATHIPSGLYTSLTDYAASFRKIDSLGCAVIPSHDVTVLARGPFG